MQQKHFISHPDQTRHARSRIKLLQKSNRERSKTKIFSNTRALRWFSSFSPEVKKAQSSLHWDCISFCQMQSEWKPVPRKPPYVEQNKRHRQNKWSRLVLCPVDTKTRPKAPAKTQRCRQIAVQKISVSGACETKLGCVLSYLENATSLFPRGLRFSWSAIGCHENLDPKSSDPENLDHENSDPWK